MALEPSSKTIFSQYSAERKYTIRHVDIDGHVSFETRQDCEPIMEHVKQMRGLPPRRSDGIVWTHFGEIPMSIFGDWMRDGRDQDPKFVRNWLNDNWKLKTFEGTL